MPKISFRNVKKVYPSGTYALNDINFDVDEYNKNINIIFNLVM